LGSKIMITALLGAALLVAGCGGDDTTSSSTTAAGASGASGASGAQGATGILPADFADQANGICKAGNVELNAAFKQLGPGKPSQADIENAVTDTIAPNIQGQIDDIRALGEPDQGADELNAFLDDAQSALDDVKADPSTLLQGDPFAKVNDEAKTLGLQECAA
jgi:hypothetical protein